MKLGSSLTTTTGKDTRVGRPDAIMNPNTADSAMYNMRVQI